MEQARAQRRCQCQLRDPQRLAEPLRPFRQNLYAGNSNDSRGSLRDGGAEDRADRFASLSGPRAFWRREPASPVARTLLAHNIAGARGTTAVVADRPATGKAADGGRRAQRGRRRRRPRSFAFRCPSMPSTRGSSTTSPIPLPLGEISRASGPARGRSRGRGEAREVLARS